MDIERIKERMHLAAQKYRREREIAQENAETLSHRDDLLNILQPVMRENAMRRREREALREAELLRYCLTAEARQTLAMYGWEDVR